jgi:arylsulfatase A-like enzyme
MMSADMSAPRAAAALAALLLGFSRAYAQEKGPLNILLIDICSARADHFGAYGYPGKTTPGMDAFAREGVVFERAMAQSSWCLSNYASLFTGYVPEVHGLYAMAPRKLPESQFTVAQLMKKAGYDTAAWSGGTWLLPEWGLDRGFDRYANTLTSAAALTAFGSRVPEMLDWIKARGPRPFFLYASIEDLHWPYAAELTMSEEPDSESVDLAGVSSRVQLLRTPGGAAAKPPDPPLPEGLPPRPASGPLPGLVAKYDASLARADAQIADFLRSIRRMGLWENTVVIITGDHGEQLGEHGLTGHMEGLYEPILHVPLLLRHPGKPQWKGRRVGELVERVDLAPTLLDIAGIPSEGLELQGRDLMELLRDPATPWRRYAFAASKNSKAFATDFILDERVVRTKRWKLHWYLDRGRYELYDLD